MFGQLQVLRPWDCEIAEAAAGKMSGVPGSQQILIRRRFKFTRNTFTVVCASNLNALVCPFSRYNLSTLGIHSRELPWKTQEQCQNSLFLFLGVTEPVSLALPWCGEQDSPQPPHHIVG